ncbi:hypothetical protein JVT61DRAFT_10314 [Boletus reticuloceps]|uniref:Uncharacterized protein n=1 Tax=Boletus reticuloceps TaxID=495285 RepID=A0A8I3AET1_9AGAM|nr:hypothetical protein JVT61DRAFT_10314 [Boletus reticuloceps]
MEAEDSGNTYDSLSDDDSEKEEARLLLEVVRAQCHVRQMEQDTVLAQLQENTAIGELYKFQADQAHKKLDTSECDLGYLRNEIRKHGISLAGLPSTHKRRRMLSDTSQGIFPSHLPSWYAFIDQWYALDQMSSEA